MNDYIQHKEVQNKEVILYFLRGISKSKIFM